MTLFCALFGHWPIPLASRRDGSCKRNCCWMCEERIVAEAGEWRLDEPVEGRPSAPSSLGSGWLRAAGSGEIRLGRH